MEQVGESCDENRVILQLFQNIPCYKEKQLCLPNNPPFITKIFPCLFPVLPCFTLQFCLKVEITAFSLERIFQPIAAHEFITSHVVYNSVYN